METEQKQILTAFSEKILSLKQSKNRETELDRIFHFPQRNRNQDHKKLHGATTVLRTDPWIPRQDFWLKY